jgi:TBC1 domain family member 20
MLDSLDPILRQLNLLNTLIRQEDKEIADFLEKSNTLPYFCLSWVITWCSHDIRDFSKVVRLFDFFIASDPIITIYLSAIVSKFTSLYRIFFGFCINYLYTLLFLITGCY